MRDGRGSSLRELLGVPVVLLVVAIVIAVQPSDYLVLVWNLALITSMLVLSLELLVGQVGLVSLAHAAYFGIGAYTSAILTSKLGLGYLSGALGASITAGALGSLLVPMGKLAPDYYAMGTLAFGIIAHTFFGNFTALTGGWTGLSGVPDITLFGFSLVQPRHQLLFISGLVALQYWFMRVFTYGYTGRSFRAIRDDEVAARAIGIPVDLGRLLAATVGCMWAGLAGSLMAHTSRFVSPDSFSFHASILLLLMVVVAGRGNFTSSLATALGMYLLDDFLGTWPLVRPMLYGALIVLTMIFFPDGIGGVASRLFARRARPAQSKADGPVGLRASNGRAHTTIPRVLDAYLNVAHPIFDGGARPTSEGVLLECKALCKDFGGLRAVSDFSMSIREGQIHGLIGPNGAGKSTILNMIAGLVEPSSGEILYLGQSVRGYSSDRRARAGLVRTFQRGRLFSSGTVFDNVAAAVGPHGVARLVENLCAPKRAAKQERYVANVALAVIDFVGLSGLEYTPVAQLPFGLRRLVEIARALAARPKLLLLDEPAAGMNPEERRNLIRLIRAMRDHFGISVVIVEHDVGLITQVCDFVTVLHYGRKIAEGEPDEVLNDSAVIAAYLGTQRGEATVA